MNSERDAHPDEGTIHAWLDRQLDAASASALEAHLQRCDECAERVAEARGLIAGASRVVAALDDPADGRASASQPRLLTKTGSVTFPTFRLTPARSAIAAVLVVAVGLAIVHEHERPSSPLARIAAESAQVAAIPPAVAPVTSSPVAAPLDSSAATRVATAREYVQAQRETTTTADRARVGQTPSAQPTALAVAAARAADSAARTLSAKESGTPVADMAPARGVAGGNARSMAAGAAPATTAAAVAGVAGAAAAPAECYRVESANGTSATWGSVPLPFVLAVDAPATSGAARVLTADGNSTDARAVLQHRTGDSLLFALRRIGYSGTLTVGAPGEVRAGVLRSAPTAASLQEVVVTSVPTRAQLQRAKRKANASTAPPRADSAAQPQRDAAPAVPVVVRRVRCEG